MNLKPKTVRRLLLLSLVGVLLVGSTFSLFVVRRWQNQRVLDLHRTEGLAAFQAGDYYTALEKTAFFFRRSQVHESDVLLALAESRRRLEEPDNRHLVLSIRPYQLYIDQNPDDHDVRRTLLELYNKAGYYIEARDLAGRMRPDDLADAEHEHVYILREEARALAGARVFGPRLEAVINRALELEPLDVDVHLIRLDAFAQQDMREESRAWGERVIASHPDDSRAQLVHAASMLVHPAPAEISQARLHLCRAAGLDPETAERIAPVEYPSDDFVKRLVALLDGVRAFQHSRQVLAEAAPQSDDVYLRRSYVRRLWQASRDEQVVAITANQNPEHRESDSDLLAFRALSLSRLGETATARTIIEALGKHKGDYRAEAWSTVIPLMMPDDDTPDLKAISALREASTTNPYEPIVHVMLGDHLAALGRREEARRAWTAATTLHDAMSWSTPWLRTAETLLAEGRVDEAVRAANEALAIAPDSVLVNVVWFETQGARIQNGLVRGPEVSTVLNRLDLALLGMDDLSDAQARDQLRDRLIPVKVILLARSNQPERAAEVARQAVAAGASPETLQQLATISISERLGLDEEIAGMIAPGQDGAASVVSARALRLARERRSEEGLELMRSAAGPSPSRASRIAIARYMDVIGHPEAASEWKRLGDEHPRDLEVQTAVLQSQAAAADREFIQRSIQRYRTLQGTNEESEDAVVRLARARMLLHGRPIRRDRDEAMSMLTALVSANPQMTEPRILLARALAMSDRSRDIAPDLPRATMHLTEAANLEPGNASVALELARLLTLQREHSRAREQLLRIGRDQQFEAPVRWQAAEMLLSTGDAESARDILAELAERSGDAAPSAMLASLAEAHLVLGQRQQATSIYEQLAVNADDPSAIYSTSVFVAKQGEATRAREIIARAEEMIADPGERALLRARFESEAGDPRAAIEYFETALRLMPERGDIWRMYATMHLARGEAVEARAVAVRGRELAPDDPGLAVVQERARLALADGGEEETLQPLIRALMADDMHSESARVLQAIEQARVRGELQSVQGLTRLASEFQNSAPLQLYVAQRLAPLDQNAAATIAMRAMNIDAADPQPARLAAELFLSLERWNEMLSAARAWRSRDRSGSAEPDVAIAEAQWRIGRTAEGLRTLSPWVSKAAANPGDPVSLAVLNLHTRMLVQSGREAEARRVLSPLLPESSDVRMMVWIGAAARDIPELAVSMAWLEEVERYIPADAVNEHLAAAVAFSMLADRFGEEGDQLLQQAVNRLDDMVATPALASAGVWETLGVIRHRLGKIDEAEDAYQRALEIEPERAVSLNNLATIAAQAHGDLDGALAYAQRAVRASEAPNPDHISTLAAVNREMAQRRMRAGDRDGAKKSYQAAAEAFGQLAAMRPRNPGPRVEQAQALWQAGDPKGAAATYEQVLRTPGLPAHITAAIKNNLAAAIRRSETGPGELQRARSLALEAIMVAEQPEFYDTLGWIELELRRPREAERAFRAALAGGESQGQQQVTAAIGLAYILKDGDQNERHESKQLISGISNVEEEFQRYLEAVRAAQPVGADARR